MSPEPKENIAKAKKTWAWICSARSGLRILDRRKINSEFRRLNDVVENDPASALPDLLKLRDRFERMLKRSLVKHADSLKCEFNPELPITAKIEEIREVLSANQVVIVCGSTGSGKTTQLPKVALMQGFGRGGRIGCTQPRRIAASALANRLSQECGCVCGKQIGYKVRFDDHTSDSTVVKFMTDGILLAETRDDPSLFQYDCIILDEVHERTLNIDFLLGYMKLLLTRRRDLRVIISSATLESGRISEFFDNAPIIEVEGRLFPIEDYFMECDEEDELADSVAKATDFLSELDSRGDMLVFLPGEREIRDVADMLNGRKLPCTEILPLFGRLSSGEQERIFKPGGLRRIILSTNVAETSLTIPGIRFVIDSGLVRLSRYNPRSRIQELRVEFISQASARQRRGRCGRLRDGVCVHLYSEEDLQDAPAYTDPEIQRSSLAGVILQMAALHLPRIEKFPFVDPPLPAHIREGLRTLVDLHAIDSHERLTRTGYDIAELPLDPHLGKILLESLHYRIPSEMIVICSFLSIQDPRERPFEHAKAADEARRKFDSEQSDFIAILNLWDAVVKEFKENSSQQALRRFAKKHYLNYRRMREWKNLVDDLTGMMKERTQLTQKGIDTETLDYDSIHKSLLGGMPRQMAVYDPETRLYSDMSGKKFLLFPGSGLARLKKAPKHILFFTLVETSRIFARCNAELQPAWLEEVAPHICKLSYDNIMWDEKSGFVYAREKVTAGQLLIHPGRRRHYAKIDPVMARNVFIREGLVNALANLKGTWLEKYAEMIHNFRQLELRMRRPESIVDDNALYRYFDSVLPPEISSVDAVKRDWMNNKKDYSPKPEDIMYEQYEILRNDDFPSFIICGTEKLKLHYIFDPGEKNDGITVLIPEEILNLLDKHFPAYLVPGYLNWKVDFLLRSLPKTLRRELMPISETTEKFMDAYREKRIFSDQPFDEAITEFLNENYNVELRGDEFSSVELPGYLKMKIALLGEKGKIKSVMTEFPPDEKLSSRVATTLKISKKWQISNADSWPGEEEMPYDIEVTRESGKMAYPALVDESDNTVGRTLFLKKNEAKTSHEHGVMRLYMIQFAPMFKHLRSMLKLSHQIDLSFFSEYHSWKNDFLLNAVRESFGGDLWRIRSRNTYENELENSRSLIAGIVEKNISLLYKIYDAYAEAETFMEKLPTDSFTYDDADAQIAFLLRKGFLNVPEILPEYPRYFRSLRIRLERAVASSPMKDKGKGERITTYLHKFRLFAETTPHWEESSELRDYFRLLQEARIAAYTPELKSPLKCSPEALEKAWTALLLTRE